MAFVQAAKQSGIVVALVAAVEALLRSGDPAERRLGAFISSRTVTTLDAELLTEALIAARDAGDSEIARDLASALHGISREPRFSYDPRLRDLALDEGLGSALFPLLSVVARHDRQWFVSNAARLLGTDENGACLRIDLIAAGLPKDEMKRFGQEVVTSLRVAASPISDAVQEEVDNLCS